MSAVTATSPVPRRVRVPSWLDVRLVTGLLLVLGSMLLGARVVAGADARTRVVEFSADLHRGSVLTRDELGYARAAVPGGAANYLTDIGAAVGRQLNRDVVRGELVPGAALDLPPATTSVVVPFGPDAAPKVAAGDRVEIWLSSPACPATVVLADVTVQAVHDSSTRSFGSAQGVSLVVELPTDLARRVIDAMAVDGAVLRAGRLRGDADDAADLVDLDSCRAKK
jgi:hypothetical protein